MLFLCLPAVRMVLAGAKAGPGRSGSETRHSWIYRVLVSSWQLHVECNRESLCVMCNMTLFLDFQ